MTGEQIPDIFANRYKIIQELGAGGMGIVYLAHDPVLNMNVAIKVLASESTGVTAVRLQREAMAAGKLNHPNIAKIFDFGQTEDGSPYMVMEYIEGKSLAELISEHGRLSKDAAIEIFEQILEGLSIAHFHKIVHRDLKPSNIMVKSFGEKDQQVKLLDFGVAKLETYSQDLTSAGALLGSPIYMSPEHAQGDQADARSDIYSFGCLMFETIAGQPPFRGQSALETISMHKTKAPPLVSEVAPDLEISNDLIVLIDSCLSKSPQARPQNCNDLLVKLKTAPQSDIETEKVFTEVQRLEPKMVLGHNPVSIAMIAIFVIAIAAFAYVMVTASIKTVMNRKENENIAKADFSQTHNTGFGSTNGDEIALGIGISQSETKDGSSSIKIDVALDDDDFERLVKNRQKADFINIALTHKQLEKLGSLPLESLRLSGKEVDDETVIHIGKMKTLKSLYCKNTLLTNKGLKSLNRLVGLETLRLGCPLVTADGLANLDGLNNLTNLQLTGNRIGDDAPLFLSSLPKLASLGLYSKSFTDKGFAQLKRLANLQVLNVSSSLVTDVSLTHLKEMKNLQMANFEQCNFSKDFGLKFAPGKKLHGLSITGQRSFSTASAEALAKTKIRILNLENSAVYDPQLIALSQMKSLMSLNIEGAPVTIKGLSALKSPPLQTLTFKSYLNLDDAIVKKISSLKGIRSLDLAHTNINDKQLIMLSVMNKLESLNLNGCPGLSFEGVDGFKKMFFSLHQRNCSVRRPTVLARDVQETENFENGKKDWRVKFGDEEGD